MLSGITDLRLAIKALHDSDPRDNATYRRTVLAEVNEIPFVVNSSPPTAIAALSP